MDEDKDDELDTKHNSKISFLWGSPLHRMPAPEPTDRYDIVDFPNQDDQDIYSFPSVETHIKNHHKSKDIKVLDAKTNDGHGCLKSDGGLISESTFAKFGYDNLPDIDTSDDENQENIDQQNTGHMLMYLNGHQMNLPLNNNKRHWSDKREEQPTTGGNGEGMFAKTTVLDRLEDTSKTSLDEPHDVQSMSLSDSFTHKMPFEQTARNFASEEEVDNRTVKALENGNSENSIPFESYQSKCEILKTSNQEKDLSTPNKGITNIETAENIQEDSHDLKTSDENMKIEYSYENCGQIINEKSDALSSNEQVGSCREDIPAFSNRRFISSDQTIPMTSPLSSVNKAESKENLDTRKTDNSVKEEEDSSINSYTFDNDEDKKLYDDASSKLKSPDIKDWEFDFSEKNDRNKMNDRFQNQLISPNEDRIKREKDAGMPETSQPNYTHSINRQYHDNRVTSNTRHNQTTSKSSKSSFYCNVKPQNQVQHNGNKSLKQGTTKTSISVKKEFDNSFLGFEGFFSSISATREHGNISMDGEKKKVFKKLSKDEGHNLTPSRFALADDTAETPQEPFGTSLINNHTGHSWIIEAGFVGILSNDTGIYDEELTNQFAIKHFGLKDISVCTPDERLKLMKIKTNNSRTGSKTNRDLRFKYTTKCEELEWKRYKIDSKNTADHDSSLSAGPFDNTYGLRSNQSEMPFEHRANQLWHMNPLDDDHHHYTNKTRYSNTMFQNGKSESARKKDKTFLTSDNSSSNGSSARNYSSSQRPDTDFTHGSHNNNDLTQQNHALSEIESTNQSYSFHSENRVYSEYERLDQRDLFDHEHSTAYREYTNLSSTKSGSYSIGHSPSWDSASDHSHYPEDDFVYTNDTLTPYQTEPYTANQRTSWSSPNDLSHNPEHNFPMSSRDHSTPYHTKPHRAHQSASWSTANDKSHNPEHNLPMSPSDHSTPYLTESYSPNVQDRHESHHCSCRCHHRCAHHSYSLKDYLSQLTGIMNTMGYEVKNVSGDGNCLFAAIVDQLRINGDFTYNTESLRKAAVKYLRETPHIDDETHLEEFLTNETWEEYLNRMELTGEWGDDIILRGISELIGRVIVVYSSYISQTTLTPTRVYEQDKLYIGHIKDMMHFVSLRPNHWADMWPMRAKIGKMRAVRESLNLDCGLKSSVMSLVSSKIEHVEKAITKKDINDGTKLLDEIKTLLEAEKTSPSIEDAYPTLDTTETMAALLHNQFDVDLLSGIPIVHFSFLVKTLVKPRFFQSMNTDLGTPPFDHDMLSTVGMNALGLDFKLMDFTEALQSLTLIQNRVPKLERFLSLTYVVKMPSRNFCIKEMSDDMGVLTSDNCLLIDDSETMPGYTRLRPTNPILWSGSVQWVSSKDVFLTQLNVKSTLDEVHLQRKLLTVKMFEGFDCKLWPSQAFKWRKRTSTSGWPTVETVEDAVEKGCLLVHRASDCYDDKGLNWQFVFTDAEKVLVQTFTEDMLYCFRVFRALITHSNKTLEIKIKSYWQLTAMFYCSEIIPADAWSYNSGGCVMFLIAWLLKQINQKEIPNYFIPENNMIQHLTDDSINWLELSLDGLRCFPFASVYFLLESHSFISLFVIDQVESSIREYFQLKDKHKAVEQIFIPISFSLAKQNMKNGIIPFYANALYQIETAYHQITSTDNDEEKPSFVDFVLSFLSSVPEGNPKLPFVQYVDKERKTNFSYLLLKYKSRQTVSDIVGKEYTGEWRDVYVDVSEDKWNPIYTLTGQLFIGGEHQECAEILRCSLKVLQKALKECDFDCGDVTADVKSQLQDAHLKELYTLLRCLVTFYKHLYKCYDAMDQTELFQEHIHDYQEIVDRIDSHLHYEQLAQIYRRLGDREKAVQLEKKAKTNQPSKGGGCVLVLL